MTSTRGEEGHSQPANRLSDAGDPRPASDEWRSEMTFMRLMMIPLLAALGACATARPANEPQGPRSIATSLPVGEVREVGLNAEILAQQERETASRAVTLQRFERRVITTEINVPEGSNLALTQLGGRQAWCSTTPMAIDRIGMVVGAVVAPGARVGPWPVCLTDADGDGRFERLELPSGRTMFSGEWTWGATGVALTVDIPYERREIGIRSVGPSQALVFQGLRDGRVLATYRTQDPDAGSRPREEPLEWPAPTPRRSAEVSAYGARLELLSATPERLRYRVLEGFGSR